MSSTQVGVTGHQNISPSTVSSVRQVLRDLLKRWPGLTGYSSLAPGTDQIFAEEVLAAGGKLVAVIPALDYESSFTRKSQRQNYIQLLNLADKVHQLDYKESSEEAYWSAGQEVLANSEVVIAVWDGKEAAGLGGTGDVVKLARSLGKKVITVWPPGSRRL